MTVLFSNSNITIYNKYYDFASGYEMYQRTVIRNVNWNGIRNATVTSNGLLMADSIRIILDKLENYISPKQFVRLTNEERPSYFTLGIADKVVKGDIDFEVTGLKPHAIANLESNFDDVVNIMSARPLSEHWEVEAK